MRLTAFGEYNSFVFDIYNTPVKLSTGYIFYDLLVDIKN